MVKLIIIATLSVISSFGCQPNYGPPETFQVSSIYTDDQVNIMQTEADILCDATDGERCFELTRDSSPHDITFDADHQWRYENSAGTAIYDPDTQRSTILVRYPDTISPNSLRKVIRHEFGHAAGCRGGHLADGNVMSTGTGAQPETWTSADIKCVLEGL